MDTIETVVSDLPEIHFGKEIAKTFVLSAAATVGMVAGFYAIGFVMTKIEDRKNKKNLVKAN
jgi:hypothetical protein